MIKSTFTRTARFGSDRHVLHGAVARLNSTLEGGR